MNSNKYIHKSCFTEFKESIDSYQLPERFTFPFHYEPHPLCILAAQQLREHLKHQTTWQHDFGLESSIGASAIGKMFGVLVVETEQKRTGFLAAYSGKLAGSNNHPEFVPPVFDILDSAGFYKKEEAVITEINHLVEKLEKDPAYNKLQKYLRDETEFCETLLRRKRQELKAAKKERKYRRQSAQDQITHQQFLALSKQLKKESLDQQYYYKRLARFWKTRLAEVRQQVNTFTEKINSLKDERKTKSALLQQQIFEQFIFPNYLGEYKSLYDIFRDTPQGIPPAGAGECAAPKLLNYAYQNNMKPLAMAEFWWGLSPLSEIRKHGHFYPACKGKCGPILGHMLTGLTVDKNPMLENPAQGKELKIVYEDETVLVINKPADFLSIPGKHIEDSVQTRVKKMLPEADGPLVVHRLDMSTSGLMLIAKTMDAYIFLQKQFIERTIKKRYIALLDGILREDEGMIDLPLRVDLDNRPRQLVCYTYGKPAKTRWKVAERTGQYTKVLMYPLTGRTHQLRVHAAHHSGLNTPIVGDDLYGTKSNRLYLHADYIKFIHPVSKKTMKFQVHSEF